MTEALTLNDFIVIFIVIFSEVFQVTQTNRLVCPLYFYQAMTEWLSKCNVALCFKSLFSTIWIETHDRQHFTIKVTISSTWSIV